MGRASGIGMSGSLIHTHENWSDWPKWIKLEQDARRFDLSRSYHEEICRLKDAYREKGTRNLSRFAELREMVDDLDWTKYCNK